MRLRKFYIGFCIALWSFWALAILLVYASGGAYHAVNDTFWRVAFEVCRVAFISCLIPIQPIVSVITMICSFLRGQCKFTGLVLWSMLLVTPILAIILLAAWVHITGGV